MRFIRHTDSGAVALALVLFSVGTVAGTPTEAQAQVVKVRSQTTAKLTQMRRIDGTVDAGRVFGQRFSLSAFDADASKTGALNAHLSFRFWNDFGLVDRLKDDSVADMYWSQTILEHAYIDWRFWPSAQLLAGRHFRMDALGARDVDGLTLRLEPRLGQGVRGTLEAWAGQDVFFETTPFAGESWDVQGVPEGSQAAEADWTLSTGVRAGLRHRSGSLEFAWMRRTYADDLGTYVGEERVGAAMQGQLSARANVVASASFHTLLEDVDRARLLVAWSVAERGPVLTTGVERVVPWFDSGSIFNLFGAQPYEGAWATAEQKVEPLNTVFDLRLFGRIYEGDQDLVDFGQGSADATTYGLGAGHVTDFRVLNRRWEWRSVATYSDSVDGAYGGKRALVQTRLGVEASRRIWLDARGLGLWAEPANHRYSAGYGLTGVLGLNWRTELGTFSGFVESSSTTFQGQNLQAFVGYEVEVWP